MIYPATSRTAGQGATYRREPGWDHRALVVILGDADNLPDTTMMIGSFAMPVAERAFRAVEAATTTDPGNQRNGVWRLFSVCPPPEPVLARGRCAGLRLRCGPAYAQSSRRGWGAAC